MIVSILGCGPAGLFAAHAAAENGAEVRIYSKPRKSFMRGAQYLHRPIPGLSRDPFEIDYTIVGSVEGYRSKVYGDLSDVQVSPETLLGTAQAWDIREAYDEAWKLYGGEIIHYDATMDRGFDRLREIRSQSHLTVSTIPAPLLCHEAHTFASQPIWSTEAVKTVGLFEHEDGALRDNLVVCSGNSGDWWYRQSRIHGWENTEYPERYKPRNFSGPVHRVEKPTWTDCTCFPGIRREGRYGRWQKGVLSHEAFYDTQFAVQNLPLEATS